MKAVVQRVSSARVVVNDKVVGSCGQGLLVLVAAHRYDSEKEAEKFADRVAGLRIFEDAEGKMNLSLRDLPASDQAQVLAVSNFTIYGETSKNRRPSFIESAPYAEGERLFNHFVSALRGLDLKVETGEFGAFMEVELVNDGPVTVVVEVPPILK